MNNVSVKAQQRVDFLECFGAGVRTLTNIHCCTIKSVLTAFSTVCFCYLSAWELKLLQKITNATSKIIRTKIHGLWGIYSTRCLNSAVCIIMDASHPAPGLCAPPHLLRLSMSYQTNKHCFLLFNSVLVFHPHC